MKKFVFAAQVFWIIALFPIYVILEMNHGIERLPENKNHPVVKDNAEGTSIQVSLNAEVQNVITIPGKILMGSTVLPGKNEIIKALAEAAYKAN